MDRTLISLDYDFSVPEQPTCTVSSREALAAARSVSGKNLDQWMRGVGEPEADYYEFRRLSPVGAMAREISAEDLVAEGFLAAGFTRRREHPDDTFARWRAAFLPPVDSVVAVLAAAVLGARSGRAVAGRLVLAPAILEGLLAPKAKRPGRGAPIGVAACEVGRFGEAVFLRWWMPQKAVPESEEAVGGVGHHHGKLGAGVFLVTPI